MKEWRKKNPEKVKAQRARTRARLRADVLGAYGGKCQCCGESEVKFLSIDHINGGGAKHRRALKIRTPERFYCWLRMNGYPKDQFQILCHNCNLAKGFYGKCPHK